MTARSFALTSSEHCRVYRSTASTGSQYRRPKPCSIQARLRFLKLVSEADRYTSSFTDSVRPAKRDRPSWMNFQRSSMVLPGARLVVAIAPALTIGLERPSGERSMPIAELNA